MMISKLSFPEIPPSGETYVCQVDGRLYTQPVQSVNISTLTDVIDHHPKVIISRDILHGTTTRDDIPSNVFSTVNQPLLKKIVHVWFEQGLLHTLYLIRDESQFALIRNTTSGILKVSELFKRVSGFLKPHLDAGPVLIESLVATNNWQSSLVRCMTWHPNLKKLAVACLDDSVRIYTEDSSNVLVLKLRFQKNVTSLAWRPNTWSELALAVGCEHGIVLWTINIDASLMVLRPSSNNAQILASVQNAPVMDLTWDPLGYMLASVSVHDNGITVWDVYQKKPCRHMYRAARRGLHIVKWARNGAKLFTAAIDRGFRVYNEENWRPETWNLQTGRVQAACFSPCGSVVLFCTDQTSVIYALQMTAEGIWKKEANNRLAEAVAVLEFSRTNDIVGTKFRDMKWDVTGKFLAVMFKDVTYVAVFNTTIYPDLQLTPCCLLTGLEFEQPTAIDFQKNIQNGACLSIAWSSGRIQHFPITTTILNGIADNYVTLGSNLNSSAWSR